MKRALSFLNESFIAESRLESVKEVKYYIFDENASAKECLADVEKRPGVYIFVGKEKYNYPTGKSPVIYIGTSKNLYSRLRKHMRNYRESLNASEMDLWDRNRYSYIKYHGEAHVYYLYTAGKEYPKTLEHKVMKAFYDKYQALPVGNGARSF